MSEATTTPGDREAAARDAARKTQDYLLGIQHEDGHWCGELEGDTILESEYILAMHFIGRTDDPKLRKAANYIKQKQLPDGGWAIYPGGPPEISASVKDYFVLKLLGEDPQSEPMVRARRAILELGGIEATNSFTKYYLAIFGQYDWERCPAIPPEMILLPEWFYINIYEMSSWSRAIVIPLSIVWHHRVRCHVPAHANIAELYSNRPVAEPPSIWKTFFQGLDRGLKLREKIFAKAPIKPARGLGIKQAHKWVLERLEDSHGLGAIFPPIVNVLFALRGMGYPVDHPTIRSQVRELERLEIEEDDTLRVQPCLSPVWDTALTVNSLVESGLAPDDPSLLRAADWLLDRRGHGRGDWRVKNRAVESPGWYFEYANPYYPDCDTTSQTIIALGKLHFPDPAKQRDFERAIDEGRRWHAHMQNDDGGWAAFDRGCDKEFLTYVPFADHNAMIDPSTSDLTSRGIEMYHGLGDRPESRTLRRAVAFLLKEQEPDGTWFGRWGCNYIYGTWLASWALHLAGRFQGTEACRRTAAWLRSCQNGDGGWGELPASYDDPKTKGEGPSTASQTAWAILGLIACGEVRSPEVGRGVDYLLETQAAEGNWNEEYWTGTGFPSVFYLKYHLYGTYFPLLALAAYLRETGDADEPRSVTTREAAPSPARSTV